MKHIFFLSRFGFFVRLAVGVCIFILLVLNMPLEGILGSSTAHADGGQPNFALQPVLYDPSDPLTESYFIFDSKPGTTITNRVRVTNSGTATGSAILYPVDATTGQTSGAVYLNQNDPRKDVGAWIKLGVQQVTLNPGQSQVISYQVIIPNTVRPGQHLGGIVAENLTLSSSPQNNSAIQIKVKNLTIVAVQVNLPGTTIEQLVGTGVQAGGDNGYQRLMLGLSNTGTVMIKPQGTLQVTDAQGQVVKTMPLKLDTFLPQTAISYPVAVTGKALNAGDYQASLTLTYGNGQVMHYSTKFTVTQQQLTQVFGTNSSKTQAPTGFGEAGGLQLWQIVLMIAGVLALLWVGGSTFYKRVVVSKAKAKHTNVPSSQFKRPMF